jgi:hypothetical protein
MKTREETNGMYNNHQHLIAGLVYTHNRANANTAELHHACATLQALGDLLIERGLLLREEVEARQQEAAEQLRQQYLAQGMAVAMQEFGTSKYQFQHAAEVDCENRIHLCHAACCKLPLALSGEDVREGVVQWELGQPYMIAHAADGYCVHMDRQACGCMVYQNRPIPCRGYDCRKDKRIWLDFENHVINPRIHDPEWPACLEVEAVNG